MKASNLNSIHDLLNVLTAVVGFGYLVIRHQSRRKRLLKERRKKDSRNGKKDYDKICKSRDNTFAFFFEYYCRNN